MTISRITRTASLVADALTFIRIQTGAFHAHRRPEQLSRDGLHRASARIALANKEDPADLSELNLLATLGVA